MVRMLVGARAPFLLGALLLLAIARVEAGAAELNGRPLPGSVLAPVPVVTRPLIAEPIVIIGGRDYLIDLRSLGAPFKNLWGRRD